MSAATPQRLVSRLAWPPSVTNLGAQADVADRRRTVPLVTARAGIDCSSTPAALQGLHLDPAHWPDSAAATASFCRSRPTSLPSEVVIGELLRFQQAENDRLHIDYDHRVPTQSLDAIACRTELFLEAAGWCVFTGKVAGARQACVGAFRGQAGRLRGTQIRKDDRLGNGNRNSSRDRFGLDGPPQDRKDAVETYSASRFRRLASLR